MKNIFKINGVEFGGKQLPIIAGPCVIESRDHILYMAEKIKAITDKNKLPLIFKCFPYLVKTEPKYFWQAGPDDSASFSGKD